MIPRMMDLSGRGGNGHKNDGTVRQRWIVVPRNMQQSGSGRLWSP